ncbi:MAG: archaellin/type IV pilin N-terminal domain-containing protein [Sulfolobales archaeon]
MLRKGISPVIATVIIVAVALILSVALAGWVMGLWGTLGSTEALQIVSASLSNATNDNLNITLVNKGAAPAKIILVSVSNATWSKAVEPGDTTDCLTVEIKPANYTTLVCTLQNASEIVGGLVYTVKVTTLSGTYTYDVRAVSAPPSS